MIDSRPSPAALAAGVFALSIASAAAPARATTLNPPSAEGAAPAPEPANGGLMIGGSVGYLAGTPQNEDMATTSGPYVGLNAGFRFVRHLYLGGVYQHGFIGGEMINPGGPAGYAGPVNNSANTNYVGVNLAYISNPDGFGFFGELGGGYRNIHLSWQAEASTPLQSATHQGGEVALGVGLHVKMGIGCASCLKRASP